MKLYHGSTIDIAEVDLALSKPNKDFGRAFYLSDDRQQALEMAQFRAEFEETEPVVNVYEFDETLFQECRATSPSMSSCAASNISKASLSNTLSAPSGQLTNLSR